MSGSTTLVAARSEDSAAERLISVQGDAAWDLADDSVGGESSDVGGSDAGGNHLDHKGSDYLSPQGDLAYRPQQLGGGHAARLQRPGAGRKGRVQDIYVDGEKDGSRPHRLDRPAYNHPYAEVANVMHKEARDSVLRLPRELLFARPVAT